MNFFFIYYFATRGSFFLERKRKIKVNRYNFPNYIKKFVPLTEGSGILRHCLRVSPSISRNSVRAHRDMQRRLRNGTATIARAYRHGKVRDKFACQTPGVHLISDKSFHVSVIIAISQNFRREIKKNSQSEKTI